MTAKKPEEKKIKIKGTLRFNHHDPYFSRFEMLEDPAKDMGAVIVSKREFCITPDFLGSDFDPTCMEVSGNFAFEISLKK